MVTPTEGLRRLLLAEATGDLRTLCRRHDVVLLTVFGSTARGERDPRDLDIAVLTSRKACVDMLGLIDELVDLVGTEKIDVVNLDAAGPLLRERALVGAIVLHEEDSGIWARTSTAAVMERMDTDWMRRLGLDLLAG